MIKRHRLPRLLTVLVALLPLAALWTVLAGPTSSPRRASGAPACSKVASPAGRGHLPGTLRGVRSLVAALRPGETGCLRGGIYRADLTLTTDGTTLRSFPGERAQLIGRLWIPRGVDDVALRELTLDGRNGERLPSPTVNGDRALFANVDVTNRHTAICFVIGSSTGYGRARGTVIRDSRVHDCGRLPATNHEHGIYVAAADETQIIGNLIYDNADRGVQLYPDARGTRVAGNVIYGNGVGVIFSGLGALTSSGTRVEHNAISGSRVRADVESWYGHATRVGRDNVVRANCLSPRAEAGLRSAHGFSAFDNLFVEPAYANAAAGDFRLPPDDVCSKLLRLGRG